MITEDYVSYEAAKFLKEKGFDAECDYLYVNGKLVRAQGCACNWNKGETLFTDYKNECSAPTLQMAMKWLREVHSILVVIDYNYECTSKSYCYKIYCLGKNGKPKKFPVEGIAYDDEGNANRDIIYYRDFQLSDSEYATYEQAVDGALYYCLEYLI